MEHSWLSDHFPLAYKAMSWVAAGLGAMSAMGVVNLTVGVLSALWLATQIFRFWAYERPRLKAQARMEAQEAATRSPQ